MAKSKTEKNCFIIMPITTLEHLVERYKGDVNHFEHVLEHLFVPALNEAGFNPVSPKSTGSNVIHADIIKQLSSCELVLCDMSILNPNVFYEFGIRTALDKPVALVVDDKTKPIPFDTSILNFHIYDSAVELWSIEKEKQALTNHVQDAYEKSKGNNALWKYFGIAQRGTFKPEEAEIGEKIDLINMRLAALEREQKESTKTKYEFLDWPKSPEKPQSDWYSLISSLPTSPKMLTWSEYADALRKLEEESDKVKEMKKIIREMEKEKDKPKEQDSSNH